MMGGEDARTSEAHTRNKLKLKRSQIEVEKKALTVKSQKSSSKQAKTWGRMERKRGTD
jgi:hypothetical protein